MKRKPILILPLLLLAFLANGQTNATDFNLSDCDGNAHHLYGKINEGKVVVLAWVMPCASCVNPTKKAYNIFLGLDSVYPGRVLFYLIDDFGNTNCSDLKTWGLTNIGGKITAYFSNSSINMYDYGTPGMPKFVVAGNPAYKVYYNLNATSTSSLPGMKEALQEALTYSSMSEYIETGTTVIRNLKIYEGQLELTIHLPFPKDIRIELWDVYGRQCFSLSRRFDQEGDYLFPLDINHLNTGIYLLKTQDQVMKFIKK